MRRLLVSAAVLLVVTAGSARAATKTYSTGNIDVPIGVALDRSLTVRDRGPVSFVRVSFRITTPDGPHLVEQQAYYYEYDDKILYLRVVCSGYRPIT